MKESIIVDGVTYVRQSELNIHNYKIVRTYSAGVFAGEVIHRDGQNCIIKNARRLWYWDGAASLSQLAMEGVSHPENCKFPCEVSQVILTNVIEYLDCTQKCIDSIRKVKIWQK